MGPFDNLIRGLTGGGQAQPILDLIFRLLGNQETGGLAGLVRKFQEQGLGDQVNSWVGTGTNLPVTADQLRWAFGEEGLEDKPPDSPRKTSSAGWQTSFRW